jgi:hypothetical protein
VAASLGLRVLLEINEVPSQQLLHVGYERPLPSDPEHFAIRRNILAHDRTAGIRDVVEPIARADLLPNLTPQELPVRTH